MLVYNVCNLFIVSLFMFIFFLSYTYMYVHCLYFCIITTNYEETFFLVIYLTRGWDRAG